METDRNADTAPKSFSWAPIYHGIAVRLLDFESRRRVEHLSHRLSRISLMT
jgi:hypothetical protein